MSIQSSEPMSRKVSHGTAIPGSNRRDDNADQPSTLPPSSWSWLWSPAASKNPYDDSAQVHASHSHEVGDEVLDFGGAETGSQSDGNMTDDLYTTSSSDPRQVLLDESPRLSLRNSHDWTSNTDDDAFDEDEECCNVRQWCKRTFYDTFAIPREPFWPWLWRHLTLGELSGSVGDLGTFIPLIVGAVITNHVNLAAVLFWAGVMNITTGIFFHIPMPVQPMKAIASVAITDNLAAEDIYAAGIVVSAAVLFLGVTKLIDVFNNFIPTSLVRGIQVGLGLSLAIKGVTMIHETDTWVGAWDCYLVALLSFGGLITVLSFPALANRIPSALILFIVGLVLAALTDTDVITHMKYKEFSLSVESLDGEAFKTGARKMALPQLPVTTLNSVVAVCALAHDLYPSRSRRRPAYAEGKPAKVIREAEGMGMGGPYEKPPPLPSARKVSISVAMMNLISCWFGGFPMCHGAGGLSGQYMFGARTNIAIIFLGSVKLVLGIFLGETILPLLHIYPKSILGLLLAMSGLELASTCRDQNGRDDVIIMLATAISSLGFKDAGVGFCVGLGTATILIVAAEMRRAFRPDIRDDSDFDILESFEEDAYYNKDNSINPYPSTLARLMRVAKRLAMRAWKPFADTYWPSCDGRETAARLIFR